MDWKVEQISEKLSCRLDEIVTKRMKDKDRGYKDFLSVILNARESEKATKNVFTMDYLSAVTHEHLLAGFGLPDQMPTAHDLHHKLPYLDQIVKEAMRFYTLTPLIGRNIHTSRDRRLCSPKGLLDLDGTRGSSKRSKKFPRTGQVQLERFDPNCEEKKQRHLYTYIPFGIGPRACLGQKFSLLEIKLTLIHLYQNHVFSPFPQD
ncbi:cytochrome P450 711A1 [Vitis vinifera]|nr:cytochrome P450 711A1 [Vitis vinifera]|eukprot:XP_019074811.1 PREDICTED: cytochrome P450 711A1-like [Vitis vinifera]